MSKSKIDQMRSMVKRAEKAEAKLTKREMENISNGEKARKVLAIIDERIGNVNNVIAEAYAVAQTEEIDTMLDAFVEELKRVIEINTEDKATITKPKRKRKVAISEEKMEPSPMMSVGYQEDNLVQSAPENVKPVAENPIQSMNDYQMDLVQSQTGFDPTDGYNMQQNVYQAGGIRYDVQ